MRGPGDLSFLTGALVAGRGPTSPGEGARSLETDCGKVNGRIEVPKERLIAVPYEGTFPSSTFVFLDSTGNPPLMGGMR